MKFLLVGLDGADPDVLFADERLEHVRQLMAGGCYGALADESAEEGASGWPPGNNDYVQVVDVGLHGMQHRLVPLGGPLEELKETLLEEYQEIDRTLGGLFELLDEDTAVAVISGRGAASGQAARHRPRGCFILAAPGSPLSGELEGVRPIDLAPTLLQLAGVEIPATMPGRSLLEGRELAPATDDLSADEEELLRERLSALGYIG